MNSLPDIIAGTSSVSAAAVFAGLWEKVTGCKPEVVFPENDSGEIGRAHV